MTPEELVLGEYYIWWNGTDPDIAKPAVAGVVKVQGIVFPGQGRTPHIQVVWQDGRDWGTEVRAHHLCPMPPDGREALEKWLAQ